MSEQDSREAGTVLIIDDDRAVAMALRGRAYSSPLAAALTAAAITSLSAMQHLLWTIRLALCWPTEAPCSSRAVRTDQPTDPISPRFFVLLDHADCPNRLKEGVGAGTG